MFLARIDGTLVGTAKHETLEGCRFLIGQRLDADGGPAGEPLVILDWMGAARGATVVVSTDGDVARRRLGNTTPSRLTVAAIVDRVHQPGGSAK
jgi:ethanolamine utilization protein EutN